METEIRDECAAEMSERLNAMQKKYREQNEESKRIIEEKYKAKFEILQKRYENLQDGGNGENGEEDPMVHLYDTADIEELVQQIKECEEEMTRMQDVHDKKIHEHIAEYEKLKVKL